MTFELRVPCPTCSGTRSTTTGDRHADTNMDVCATCHDVGTIPARPGESAESSFGFVNRDTTATNGKEFPKTDGSFLDSEYGARTALVGKIAEARRYADREGFEYSTLCLPREDTDALLAALSAAPAARPGDGVDLTLTELNKANIARQAEWCPDQVPDLSFRGNELAGEAGEVSEALILQSAEIGRAVGRTSNVIKKLERERYEWRGSRATKADLADELADVIIWTDLCAVTAGIDLSAAVVAKFNATSDKVGILVRLAAAPAVDGGRA